MTPPPTGRPTRQALLDFIAANPGKVGKRELARAFALKGADKDWLKAELRALKDDGAIVPGRGRRVVPKDRLPEVTVLRVTQIRRDGEAVAVPVAWRGEGEAPQVTIAATGRGRAPGSGDRVLARLEPAGPLGYRGKVIRVLESGPGEVVGTLKLEATHGRILPADRRARHEVLVAREDLNEAKEGEVVVAELVSGRLFGLPQGRVLRSLGKAGDPRTFSRIAIAQNDIPVAFPAEALAEAKRAKPVGLEGRTDLTAVPLVTIDPEDARDHDDAVFAEPDDDPQNAGGWRVLVAIADVSWYVRPGSALDRAARERGNSVYFPDMVVPMLPERLSADLCSLVEGEPRACLAVTLKLDAQGELIGHRFVRGLMRSRASLTYSQVQRAHDGETDAVGAELHASVIRPLYQAYAAAAAARDRREPLAIDMPERKVELDRGGHIRAVGTRERFDSHRLIEEFMILANVAAAETLERARRPCMYRIHEQPSKDKLEALRDFLDTLDIRLAKGQVIRPQTFNRVLARVGASPQAQLVNEVVLRAQMQAAYSPDNIGHFGLNLPRYAHFTSPIRRYADLLVHRALVDAGRFGAGGLSGEDVAAFADTADLISRTERRAMQAERDALDRYVAAFMERRVGEVLSVRVTGVSRAGLFLTEEASGATGLAPMASLGDDYFVFDERARRIQGKASKASFRLGDVLEAELIEANPIAGGLLFGLGGGRRASPAPSRGGRPAAHRPGGKPGRRR